MPEYLGEFEQVVLLAVLRLGKGALRRAHPPRDRGGRQWDRPSPFVVCQGLESKRYLDSWFGAATALGGGRSKRHFEVLAAGSEALARSKHMLDRMWQGLHSKGARHA